MSSPMTQSNILRGLCVLLSIPALIGSCTFGAYTLGQKSQEPPKDVTRLRIPAADVREIQSGRFNDEALGKAFRESLSIERTKTDAPVDVHLSPSSPPVL
jgi:hypothetical protein